MSRRKEEVPPEQSRFFFDQAGKVRLSALVSTSDYGALITDFLEERAIWKEIPPEGNLLLIEANEEEVAYSLDRDKLLKLETVNLDEHKSRKHFAAAIIVFPYNLINISQDGYLDLFGKAASLTHQDSGGFFVFEKIGPDENLVWRKEVLKKVGLVNTKIFTSQRDSNYLIWSGRFRKEPDPREPVNIIDREHPNKHYWVARRLWKNMIGKYHSLGYEMYKQEETELFNRLQSSMNIREDLHLLDMMMGVMLKSTCGCIWKVPIRQNQEWERIEHCPDEDCDGVPKLPVKQKDKNFPLYQLDKVIQIESLCWDCGQKLNVNFREISQHGERVVLQRDIYCSHCQGTLRTEKIHVQASQVVGLVKTH